MPFRWSSASWYECIKHSFTSYTSLDYHRNLNSILYVRKAIEKDRDESVKRQCNAKFHGNAELLYQVVADSFVWGVFFKVLHFNLLFHASDAMNSSTGLANFYYCFLSAPANTLHFNDERELVKIKSIFGFFYVIFFWLMTKKNHRTFYLFKHETHSFKYNQHAKIFWMNHLEKQVQQKQQLILRFCYFITVMSDLAATSLNRIKSHIVLRCQMVIEALKT